jgi:hypothetical protein
VAKNFSSLLTQKARQVPHHTPGTKTSGIVDTRLLHHQNVQGYEAHWQRDGCSILGSQRHFAHRHNPTIYTNKATTYYKTPKRLSTTIKGKRPEIP